MTTAEVPIALTRLLFVEDHARFRSMVISAFREIGFSRFDTCASLAEANSSLLKQDYTHVICDWKLPEPEGISFLLSLRKRNPTVHLILLTGHTLSIDPTKREYLESQSIAVVSKSDATPSWLAGLSGAKYLDPIDEYQDLVRQPAPVIDSDDAEIVDDYYDIVLENDALRRRVAIHRDVLQDIAGQELDDLRLLASSESFRMHRAGESLSAADILSEIETQTPRGRAFLKELIDLERVRRNIVERNRPGLP